MAIWQFSFYLIPMNVAFDESRKDYVIDDFEYAINLSDDTFEPLIEVFSIEKSWSKAIMQFGDLESSCLEFYFNEKMVENIHVRFDLRSITLNQVYTIVSFASHNQLIALIEGKIVEVNKDNLIAYMRSSDAYKFISDPSNFLARVKV